MGVAWEITWFPSHPDFKLVVRSQLSFPFGQKAQIVELVGARIDYQEFAGRIITYHKLRKCAHVTCKANKKHPAEHDHDKTISKTQLYSERLFTKILAKEYAQETLSWKRSHMSVPILGSKGSRTP